MQRITLMLCSISGNASELHLASSGPLQDTLTDLEWARNSSSRKFDLGLQLLLVGSLQNFGLHPWVILLNRVG